jgi:pimeloyl-ACP methyl ester carboxylesterase
MPAQFLDPSPPAGPVAKKQNGIACELPDECASGRCQSFKCEAQPPATPKKLIGAGCILGDQCASGRCHLSKCEAQPPPAPKKPGGALCALPDECASGSCWLFKCQAPPTCVPAGPAPAVSADDPTKSFSPFWRYIGYSEGRLREDLRNVARAQDPEACALPLAAIHYGLGGTEHTPLGQAFADLSVTGKAAFEKFGALLPKESYCQRVPARARSIRPACGAPAPAALRDPALVSGCLKALRRAYDVANFLRQGQALPRDQKMARRKELGWIAVSGEDDSPHRPVNVPSSDHPQYDFTVNVAVPAGPSIRVRSRYVLAQAASPQLPRIPLGFTLASLPTPSLPADAEVYLFIHGMDSRAEEATDFTEQLFKLGKKNAVVLSFDLPSSGYADNIDHFLISPLETVGTPKDVLGKPVSYANAAKNRIVAIDFGFTGEAPLLDFIETFIVRAVEQLDAGALKGLKNKIKVVLGGSMGGNMTFRLGRRCRSERAGPCAPGESSDLSWLPSFIVWSPSSIWSSLGEAQGLSINIDWKSIRQGNIGEAWKNFIHGSNFDATSILKRLGPLTALLSANNVDPNDPNDLLSPERRNLRRDFFGSWDKPILPILVPMAQSDTWQSDYYPCKKSMVVSARLDRHETYDPRFLRWHWRVGAEMLLYSHESKDKRTGQPRYLSNVKPMLLMCGTEDRILFNDICGATQRTATKMTNTPGRAMFLEKTGHSVDNERAAYFAQQAVDFLDKLPKASSAR